MAIASLICFILFIGLLAGLNSNWAVWVDNSLLTKFSEESFLSKFSFLGSEAVLGGGAILLILFLLWKRNKAGIAAVLLGVGGGNAVNKLLKEWVARERPPFPHGEDGFSFVSGHAMVGMIFYLLAAYFIGYYTQKKTAVYAGALLLAFLAGASRITEKAHYATDVAAGWLLGGAVFFLISFFLTKRLKKSIKKAA